MICGRLYIISQALISNIIWIKRTLSSTYGSNNSTTVLWRYFEHFWTRGHNFQWSRAYSYYSSPSAQKEVIWTSEIARAGCVPEVFDCKELVSWCAEKYIPSQQMIQLQDHSPIILSPQVFRKMLKLPEPTLTFKGEDCRDFLKKHDNGLDILPEFLENPT
jgi:hypothetical protein